jgi:hypothetical protein
MGAGGGQNDTLYLARNLECTVAIERRVAVLFGVLDMALDPVVLQGKLPYKLSLLMRFTVEF